MKRRALVSMLAACACAPLLAACAGVPLTSVPRLLRLQDAVLDADPGEFMLAVQMDARMAPPLDAVPTLQIDLRPATAGAFAPIERALPMQMVQGSTGLSRLPPAGAGRRWVIYSLPESSRAALIGVQQRVKALKAEGKRGGSLSVGIAQERVPVRDPVFADTRWESWLQTSRAEGFYEVWTGTVAALLRQAKVE